MIKPTTIESVDVHGVQVIKAVFFLGLRLVATADLSDQLPVIRIIHQTG